MIPEHSTKNSRVDFYHHNDINNNSSHCFFIGFNDVKTPSCIETKEQILPLSASLPQFLAKRMTTLRKHRLESSINTNKYDNIHYEERKEKEKEKEGEEREKSKVEKFSNHCVEKEEGDSKEGNIEEKEEELEAIWQMYVPEETLLLIFSFLDVAALMSVERTCRLWQRVSKDKFLGKSLNFKAIRGRRKLDDKHLDSLLSRTENLIALNISGCMRLSNRSISTICRTCPKLERLDISGCKWVNDDTIRTLCHMNISEFHGTRPSYVSYGRRRRRMKKPAAFWLLRRSNIEGNPVLHNLRSINLNYCYNLSDLGIDNLCRTYPKLTRIHLSNNNRITSDTCVSISKNLKDLTLIDLTNCNNINGEALDQLFEDRRCNLNYIGVPVSCLVNVLGDFPTVTEFHLSAHTKLSNESILHIAKKMPNLRVLNLSSTILKKEKKEGEKEEEEKEEKEEKEEEKEEKIYCNTIIELFQMVITLLPHLEQLKLVGMRFGNCTKMILYQLRYNLLCNNIREGLDVNL